MTVIQLNRKTNTLIIGRDLKDINDLVDVSFLYDITYIRQHNSIYGWYFLYGEDKIVGFVTDVEYIKEKW